MIRSRSLKRIKLRTPGKRTVIHLKKHPKKSLFKISPKIKKEEFKEKVRK
jgi:ribosomal protein L34E